MGSVNSVAMAKPRGTIPLLPLLQTALAAGLVGLACRVALLHARLTALEPGGRVPSFITPQHQYPGRARGAARGRVACDADVSRLVSYWSDPRSDADRAFRSPFLPTPGQPRYLSFEPDLVSVARGERREELTGPKQWFLWFCCR